MGEKLSGFIVILILCIVGYAIFAWGGMKITENLAAHEYAQARIEEAQARQEQAIQEARQVIEETRQDNATQRADSRNITLAAIAGMVISQQANGNWLIPLALGATCAWLYLRWRDSQSKG